jgi:hypothetical protein
MFGEHQRIYAKFQDESNPGSKDFLAREPAGRLSLTAPNECQIAVSGCGSEAQLPLFPSQEATDREVRKAL